MMPELDVIDATLGPIDYAVERERRQADPHPPLRTLADVDDAPPADLLVGMLEPQASNIFNARGGVGKSTTAAYLIGELQAAGVDTLIYDAENREREYARRCSGLGVNRRRVAYLQPRELPSSLIGQPLWEIAAYLGQRAQEHGAGLILVDSVQPAVGIGDERLKSDPQVPYLCESALEATGVTSLLLTHPPKGQPDGDPFGSGAWVQAARLTWNGANAEGAGHRVRWRPKKRNERGYIAPVLLTFEYDDSGRLSGAARENDDEATRDWILAALTRGPRTKYELAGEMADDMDEPLAGEAMRRVEDRLAHQLRRMAKDGWVHKKGKDGRADRWSLAEQR